MKSEFIVCEKQGPFWNLVLNRPRKANALTLDMLQALTHWFTEAANDARLRVLTISGAGDRVFCAGADLSELTTDDDAGQDSIWNDMSDALNALPVLTIALVNGPCIGGGMNLLLGCDLRVAVTDAHFSYPALKNGVLPGPKDSARLLSILGPGKTARLLLAGCELNAAQALDWNLVDFLCERQELDSMATELASVAVQAEREHLAAMKRLCRGDET